MLTRSAVEICIGLQKPLYKKDKTMEVSNKELNLLMESNINSKELLKKIAIRFEGIAIVDLTKLEKQIAKMLEEKGYLFEFDADVDQDGNIESRYRTFK